MKTRQLDEQIIVNEAPQIPGLVFRKFRGESDFPAMLEVINGANAEDDIDESTTLQDITHDYKYLENCDPTKDMLMAEVDGKLIGYTRVFWRKQEDGLTIYRTVGKLLPEKRRKGIGTAMFTWTENRLRNIAGGHTWPGRRSFQAGVAESENGTIALLEKFGYQPARYFFMMKRLINDPLPEAPMPPGLEVRPALEEHIRQIWDADNEAFKDHWGYVPTTENNYLDWKGWSGFQPDLWKIAWDGDQVAGMVLNFIDRPENKEFNRLRGYTEGISVCRPWRKKGLARSLIVQSINMFKEMGMTETALGVDSLNLSGALSLHEGVGYRNIKQYTTYRKPLD